MILDYAKAKVEDIKQALIEDGVFTEEQLGEMKIKGKSQWVDLHKLVYKNEESEYQFEMPEEQVNKKVVIEEQAQKPNTPGYNDVAWHDYVMSQFAPNELISIKDKKYPNLNGLRRVAGLLLGEIIQAGPIEVKTTMDPSNSGKAVIVYEIIIEWKLSGMRLNEIGEAEYGARRFVAVGSSYEGNTDDMYAVFPEAIAESRAEGRALRRALRLGVVCADELTYKDTAEVIKQQRAKASEKSTDGSWEESAIISDNQVNSIKLLCDRLNIDVQKFINSGSKKYNDILEVSRQSAAGMIKKLSEYQSTSNSSDSIPSEILK